MAINLNGTIDSPMAGQPKVLTGSLSDVNLLRPSSPSATRSLGLGSAVVGGAFNILGSILGNDAQDRANRANRELAELQNKWNVQQWERENEYNKPLNQLKRYTEAGVNPLLALANMEPGNAPNIQSADLANQQAFTDFSGVGQAGETFANINIAKQNADTARYSADTQRMAVESDMPLKRQQLFNLQQEEKNLKATQNNIVATTNHIHWLISNAKKEGIKLQKEIDYQGLINSFEEQFGSKIRQAQIDNLLADTKHKNALIREINNNMFIAKKQLEIAIKSANFNIENGKKLTEIQRVTCNNNAKLMKQNIRHLVAQGKLTKAEGRKKELEVDNYWNQRGQDFLQQTFNFLMMALLLRGKNVMGSIGKGSYKPPTMDGKPPVPYN